MNSGEFFFYQWRNIFNVQSFCLASEHNDYNDIILFMKCNSLPIVILQSCLQGLDSAAESSIVRIIFSYGIIKKDFYLSLLRVHCV